MGTNGNTKIYYGKKSNNLRNYIIIIIICIIIGVIIGGEVRDYIIIISAITTPLCALFIEDYTKTKNLKIELNNKTLKLKNLEGTTKEITYENIKLVYVIIGNLFNESKIQIIEKSGKTFTEINVKYIDNVKNLLEDLYKKKIIICNIHIMDSYTNNQNDPKAIFRGPVLIGKNPPVQEPYAITRTIGKKYWGIPEDETEEFEKENNLIDGDISEDKNEINVKSKSKKKKTKKYTIIEA